MLTGLVASFRKQLSNPFCVALDLPSWAEAVTLLSRIDPLPAVVKIGPMLYFRDSGQVGAWLLKTDLSVFLDFKWHDIPNTVSGSVDAIPGSSVRLLTVHAHGGKKMIGAARDSADTRGESGRGRPLVLAVTVLTHLDGAELRDLGIRDRGEEVRRLGTLALESGADGLVMAPGDLEMARREWGQEPFIVTPGIRLPETTPLQNDDQVLAETPRKAIEKGADLLVIGRPVVKSPDPGKAWKQFMEYSSG